MTEADRADVFRGVAHPLRRRVLRRLQRGERSVGALLTELKVAMPTLSRHLLILRETGLVTQRRDGPYRLYRLNKSTARRVRDWAKQLP